MEEKRDILELLVKKYGSKYLVTLLAAKRAKQLQMGDVPPLLPPEEADGKDPLTIALQELLEDKLLVEEEGRTPAAPEVAEEEEGDVT